MKKIIALYRNEMYKIFTKSSVFIFAVLIALSVLITPILIRIVDGPLEPSATQNANHLIDDRESYQLNIENANTELELLLSEGASIDELTPYLKYIDYYELEITIIDYKIDNKHYSISEMGMLNIMIEFILNLREITWAIIEDIAAQPNESNAMLLDNIKNDIEYLFNLLDTKDIESFVDFSNSLIDSPYIDYFQNYHPSSFWFILGNDSKLIRNIEHANFIYRIDPEHGLINQPGYHRAIDYFQLYSDLNHFINEGVILKPLDYDLALVPLNEHDEKQILNEIAMLDYKIDNNELNLRSPNHRSQYSFPRDIISSVGLIFVALISIILAGSTISQEFAEGSIKSIIIAPIKRWKIYLAKYLSLFTAVSLGIVIVWFFSSIGYHVFYGNADTYSYLFVINSKVFSIPFHLFHLIQLCVSSINIYMLTAFAFMLSTITKNSALSVGISLGAFFLSMRFDLILTVLLYETRYPYTFWMDFIPFAHFNIAPRIFIYERLIYSPFYYYDFKFINFYGPSLSFSVIYLIVLFLVMYYIGLDSFSRKDIK